MRLVEAELIALEVPFVRPLRTAAGTWASRRLGIVRLVSSDGHVGLGEVAGDGPGGLDVGPSAALTLPVSEVDPADPGALEAWLDALAPPEAGGAALRAAAASAMLDLRARTAGRSVAALLSVSTATSVAVNAVLGIDRPDGVVAEALRLVRSGFRCLKLKGGGEAADDIIERVAAARRAVGTATALRLDLNGALDERAAIELLERLAPAGLEYVEQPVAAELGPDAPARIRRATSVAVAADESVTHLEAARAIVGAGAADVLVVKPARVGGLERARAIAELAMAAGLGLTISTFFESGVGLAGALQLASSLDDGRAHGLATGSLSRSQLLERPLEVVGGRMALPGGIGLGVTLDADAVEAYRA